MSNTRCTATKRDGTPCRAWAIKGTAACSAHSPNSHVGAPPGNQNAARHGLYAAPASPAGSIQAVIADLAAKQQALSDYIDRCIADDTPIEALAHLLALHGQNASRLGRLLRDHRALSGEAADGIAGAIAQALDELSNELGAPL